MKLALAAALWVATAAVTLAAIAWASRRHHRPLPEEAALVFVAGEPAAWVLTDLGVARVDAPTDLAAVGWVNESEGIQSWWHTGTSRAPAVDRPHMAEPKRRWALDLRPFTPYTLTLVDAHEDHPRLFEVER